MINANADRLCTWQDEANCRACSLRLLLGCRLNMREFHFFVVNQMPNLGMAVFRCPRSAQPRVRCP
jgi:hypothetical protein